MFRAILRTATCGLAALLAMGRVEAGQFSISPLRLDLAAAATTTSLTVRNEEAAAVVVQAQALGWTQEGGQDALSPTRDLLVSPAVFTLAPGGSQLVRVALRAAPDATRELAYRLALQEVPQPAAPGFTGLQVALRLSVPLFVAATKGSTAPDLQWNARVHDDGRLEVVAHNDGEGHARIRHFTVKGDDGATTLYEQPALAYVLPGASRQWLLEAMATGHTNNQPIHAKSAGQKAPLARARLEGTTDEGEFATDLELVR